MVSDFIESHSPVFFSAGLRFVFQLKCIQKTRRRFLQSVVERAKQKKPFVFPNNEPAKRPVAGCFCICFYLKMKRKPAEKIQGCDFLLNRRPHAKIQLIWTKKKNRPKFDIEWLCSDVFNYSQNIESCSYAFLLAGWLACRDKQ